MMLEDLNERIVERKMLFLFTFKNVSFARLSARHYSYSMI